MQYTNEQIEAMTGRQLVEVFNSLVPDAKRIRKFSDHLTGVKRVLALLGNNKVASPKVTAPPEKAAKPAPTPTPAPAPSVVEDAKPKAARKPKVDAASDIKPRIIAARKGDVKPPRPESKRGQLLVVLQTAKGMTVEEMMARFEWKVNDCGDALRLLARQNGIAVERGEDGRWRTAK